MKIPETSANVGAYYGSDENGQWQPNGVVIDNGVGGGVVGSGDAGVRPMYPVHIPRHMPTGYVMAGAYYPPQFAPPLPPQPADFEDYMWMENEEEFDKQVIQQLEEEALMEQCIEAMLEDEQRERRGSRHPRQPRDPNAPTTSTCNGRNVSLQEAVSRSTLNPLAAEFVPTRPRVEVPTAEATETTTKSTVSAESPPQTETHTESERETETETDAARPAEPSAPEAPSERPDSPERSHDTEEAVSSAGETVEVSALAAGKRERRTDTRRPNKSVQEVKKSKPQARSETQLKEVREQKAVKSESDEPVEPAYVAQSATEEESTGPKPINYAAAAKAMKPKPKQQDKELKPRPVEKETKPKTEVKKEVKPEKKELKKVNKDKVRKNSAK